MDKLDIIVDKLVFLEKGFIVTEAMVCKKCLIVAPLNTTVGENPRQSNAYG
jgi:hypothetical protein